MNKRWWLRLSSDQRLEKWVLWVGKTTRPGKRVGVPGDRPVGRSPTVVGVAVITFTAVLFVLLARGNVAPTMSESDSRILRSDNALQVTIIATQASNFNQFNQIAENAG